jgi:hypothetical protein
MERLDFLFTGHPVPSACKLTFHIIQMMIVQGQGYNRKLFILNVIYVVSSKCSCYLSISKKYKTVQ